MVEQFDLGVDEAWPLRRPEHLVTIVIDSRIGDADPASNLVRIKSVGVVGQHAAVLSQLHPQAQIAALPAGQAHVQADLPSVRIRRPTQLIEICFGNHFKPDALPDAGGAVIPDGVRLRPPVLLAARLCQVGRIVLGSNDQRLRIGIIQQVSNVHGKRRVPAFVSHGQFVIQPDTRTVIHRTEVEDHALAHRARGRCEKLADTKPP